MYKTQVYDSKADIWSLGVLFYVIISGFMPFDPEDMPKLVKMKTKNIVNFSIE
jgi:serine/threonine protein kinase